MITLLREARSISELRTHGMLYVVHQLKISCSELYHVHVKQCTS
jgi:hypothetical protein